MTNDEKSYVKALELSVQEFDSYDEGLKDDIDSIDRGIKLLEKQRFLKNKQRELNTERKASVLKSISDTIGK